MTFPKFKYCLIADNARDEANGKVTLLGFLGISPEVELFIGPPAAPPGVLNALGLSFLFIGGPGSGTFDVTYELYDVDQKKVLATINTGQPTQLVPRVPTRPGNTNFVINVTMPVPHFGEYELRLLVSGQVTYTGRFKVSQQP